MLRAFDALLRERSVSRAAGRLFLSQPAVSASLNRLRRVFGDTLFMRTPHGVVPTPRALALAPQVARVLEGIEALLSDDDGFDPAASERVFRIAGSDFMSERVLPALCRCLDAAGSAARIMWEAPGSAPIAERLLRGDLDLALIARLRPERKLHTLVLYEDRYVYALRRGHPRAHEALTPALFCQIPQTFLGYGSSVLDDRIDEMLARHGQHRLARVAVSSFAQVLHQLEHCDHAAVLGRRVAEAYAERLHLAPMPFELPPYQSLMAWAPAAERDPGVRWLRALVLHAFGVG